MRIAVQQHGEPLPDMVEALAVAGADVIEVPVYRWEPPADLGPLDRLTDATRPATWTCWRSPARRPRPGCWPAPPTAGCATS